MREQSFGQYYNLWTNPDLGRQFHVLLVVRSLQQVTCRDWVIVVIVVVAVDAVVIVL